MSEPERFERFYGPEVTARVAAIAGVSNEPWMQDWPIEVSDENRVEEFIALYENATDLDDRYALMDLILSSLDARGERGGAAWSKVYELLLKAPKEHAYQMMYWSDLESCPDGRWRLTPAADSDRFAITSLAECALLEVYEQIGFTEFDPEGGIAEADRKSFWRSLGIFGRDS